VSESSPPHEPPPLVIKIGGGLLRDEGLEGLGRACAEATKIAARRPVLVVPGGGPFADAVRAVDRLVGLGDDVAHTLALRAMDQLGVLLRPLLPAAELLADLVVPRALALLQVAPAFTSRPGVPESWTVTSDSLAVLAAAAIGADEAVLLKCVDGVLARWPSNDAPLPALTADELGVLQARGGARVVDAYLPEALRRTGVVVVVRAPGGSGTRITQARPHAAR
jgi:5-(aminomethyl)-3-furanmethanol phosphate kinase